MNWYKKAQEVNVTPEYWQSLGSWVLVPSDQPKDRHLRPMGQSTGIGLNIEIFEFDTKEKAINFAVEKGWNVS